MSRVAKVICGLNRIGGAICLLLGFLLVGKSVGAESRVSDRNVVIQWNNATLQGIRDSKLAAPAVARALAIVHTCAYDAWSACDDYAVSTQLAGVLRTPLGQHTLERKEQAISYAAFTALRDLLPVDTTSVYVPLMKHLGYNPEDRSTDISTPIGIGNVSCYAVLEYRHKDKANQLGDAHQGVYSDWSRYEAKNLPTTVPSRSKPSDLDHWQPLIFVDGSGTLITQQFVGAQWCFVTPFSLLAGDEFRYALRPRPAKYGTPEFQQEAEELVKLSGGLTDSDKMASEYWSDGPDTEQPPGHWALFAQFVSARDNHSVDEDVKMCFVLTMHC